MSPSFEHTGLVVRVRWRRRSFVFLGGTLAAVLVNEGINAASSHYVRGNGFTDWWWLLPMLAGAALIIRPAWGAAVAGIAAGNVALLSSPGSFTWTSPDRNISVFTGITAMAITVLLLGFRCVQLFAPALTEAHALHRTWSARRATNPGQS
jgi:hypothetical protein